MSKGERFLKSSSILIGGLLIAGTAWLATSQARLQKQVDALVAENRRLAEEIAERPAMSPQAFADAQRRLDRAQVFMDAAESRLTNATELLTALQQAAAERTGRSPRSRVSRFGDEPPAGAEVSTRRVTPRPSSSHTAEGQLRQRPWGPEQVIGPPNTDRAGDFESAWAPLNSNGAGEEWLHLNYERAVEVSEIRVRETYNPGAVSKIAAFLADGREMVLWEGVEPDMEAPIDVTFNAPPGIQAQSIKVYLDRNRVSGWNEIDAVELVGRDGSRQWALSATASSSYAEQGQ